MGNENHHHPHHDLYHHQNLHIHHRSTFLPMLCSRTSIKSVSLPQRRDHHPGSFSNNPLSPRIGCMGQVKRDNKIAQLPTSQQHRLSLTTTKSNTISISSSPIVKYSKLKKLFSAKNLTTTTTAPPSSCGRSQRGTKVLHCDRGSACASSCVVELQTNTDRYGRNCCHDAGAGLQNPLHSGPQFKSLQVTTVSGADMPRNRNQRCGRIRNENVVPISIENMDPPLPVIKGVRKSEEGISLWKRRSGGAALKSLKLPQIHHPSPRHHLQLTSV